MSVETAKDPLFGSMQRQVNKMMEQMQKGFYGFCASETWTPNVNLYETQRSYLVCVDLAGVVKEAIDLVVNDGRLTLRGTRAVPVMPSENDPTDDDSASGTAGRNAGGDAHESATESAGVGASAGARRETRSGKRHSSPPPEHAQTAAQTSAQTAAPSSEASASGDSDDSPQKYRVHLMEIDHGQFVREVELPDDVRKDDISATYRNGLLWIELPKR